MNRILPWQVTLQRALALHAGAITLMAHEGSMELGSLQEAWLSPSNLSTLAVDPRQEKQLPCHDGKDDGRFFAEWFRDEMWK